MTEHEGEIPLSEKVTQHLLFTQTEQIAFDDERIGLLLPASTEMLEAMRSGNGLLVDLTPQEPDTLHAFATASLAPRIAGMPLNNVARALLGNRDETYEESTGFAEILAQAHYFMDQLGMPFGNPEAFEKAMNYVQLDEYAKDIFTYISGSEETSSRKELGVSLGIASYVHADLFDKVEPTVREARERSGHLLGIAIGASSAVQGNAHGSEPSLSLPTREKGIAYTAIVAHQQLGPHEKRYIYDLRKRK